MWESPLDFLVALDTRLFIFFNLSVANPIFDRIMPVITNAVYWRPFLAALVLYLLIRGGSKGRITVLLLAGTIAFTDQISSHLIKSLVERVRPCQVIPEVHLLVGCSNSYSFPSSHAANSFAFATIFFLRYRWTGWLFFPLAAVIAYSRVAVGVHYPFDILGGAMLGLIVSFSIYQFYCWLNKRRRAKINIAGRKPDFPAHSEV